MTIFAILRADNLPNNQLLHDAIHARYPTDSYRSSVGQWLVASDKTTVELCTELGIVPKGSFPGTIVLAVSSYYGVHNLELWDWIKAKWEKGTANG